MESVYNWILIGLLCIAGYWSFNHYEFLHKNELVLFFEHCPHDPQTGEVQNQCSEKIISKKKYKVFPATQAVIQVSPALIKMNDCVVRDRKDFMCVYAGSATIVRDGRYIFSADELEDGYGEASFVVYYIRAFGSLFAWLENIYLPNIPKIFTDKFESIFRSVMHSNSLSIDDLTTEELLHIHRWFEENELP